MKELGAPDENRRRAEKLNAEPDAKRKQKKYFVGYGCDETDLDDQESDEYATVKKQKRRKSAKEYAMSLVSIKSYTEQALRQKLKIRTYGCDEIDEAVAYVKSFGYINDLRLAQNAAEKLASKPCGKRKIFAYLRQKGISGEVIEQIDLSEIDFKANAIAYAKKSAALGKTREQIARSLVTLGFSASEISHAVSIDIDINED